MFTNYASVSACYKYIKLGGGAVDGNRSLRGCCVSSGGCRAASLLVFLCTYGKQVMALVFIWILCVKQILVVVFYCALTCGSFVLERCSAVWRLGAGDFLVV